MPIHQEKEVMMFQLRLRFFRNKDALKDYFEKMTRKDISLFITDNSNSVLSTRTKDNSLSVRMHWMFLNAGHEVIREIVDFIKTRKGRTPLIRKFINDNQTCLRRREQSAKPVKALTQGRFHNLSEIFASLNNEYFSGRITATISWGKGNVQRTVKKRTLGSYCVQTDTIRINPVLDKKNVPRYFIRYVVYHEMLHSTLRGERKNGRRSVHPPAFRKRERLFKDYARAISWERRWI
jgi:hypothetical protein